MNKIQADCVVDTRNSGNPISGYLVRSGQITLQMNTPDQQVIYSNINEGIQYQRKTCFLEKPESRDLVKIDRKKKLEGINA